MKKRQPPSETKASSDRQSQKVVSKASPRIAKSFRDMAYDGQAALEQKISDAFEQMKRGKKTKGKTERSEPKDN
jgi:hypothetical protein|tara:strand:- start:1715 stop:1936 length:222 start_codon:yes stop_codon:yes gene_type:complete